MQRPSSSRSLECPEEGSPPSPVSSVTIHHTPHFDDSQQAPEEQSEYPIETEARVSDHLGPPKVPSITEAKHNGVEYGPVPMGDKATDIEFRNKTFTAPTILTNYFAVALPLAVLIFVVAVWRLDGTQVGEGTLGRWRNAITVMATLFPILFASIIGRLMSAIAKWKLENGTSIGTLEQLIGSRTVGSTVQTFYQFRIFNLLGIALIITWLLSPLGAQAFLRTLSSQLVPKFEVTDVTYFDNLGASRLAALQMIDYSPDDIKNAFLTYINSLYTTLITTPEAIKLDAMDLWGNVKIPFLPQNTTTSDWINVSGDIQDVQYSSLAGIPMRYSTTGNTTLLIESSYIHLDCSNLTRIVYWNDTYGREVDMESGYLTSTDGGPPATLQLEYSNGTWYGHSPKNRSDSDFGVLTTWGLALDRFINSSLWPGNSTSATVGEWNSINTYVPKALFSPSLFEHENGIEVGPTNLLLQLEFPPRARAPSNYVEITCGVSQKYVESRVNCSRGSYLSSDQHSCTVIAYRPSQQLHASERISHLAFPRLFNHVSRQLPIATGRRMGQYADMSVNYLKDPMLKNISVNPAVTMDEIDSVGAQTIGVRLGQLLNTYLTLSQLSFEITSGSAGENAAFQPQVTADADTGRLVELYVLSKAWGVLCIVSCIVVLAGGILSVVFTHWSHGPEILGYVSTMVRDSRLMDLEPETSWLDGAGLSKRIKSQRVRFGFSRQVKEPNERLQRLGVGYEEDMERIKNVAARK